MFKGAYFSLIFARGLLQTVTIYGMMYVLLLPWFYYIP